MDRVQQWVLQNFQENVISDSEQSHSIAQNSSEASTNYPSDVKVLQDHLITDGDDCIASSADTLIRSPSNSTVSEKSSAEAQINQIDSTSSEP